MGCSIIFLGDHLSVQANKVSGVTMLATSARTFRPKALAFKANLRR